MVSLFGKYIRGMNFDINRVIEYIFSTHFHKYEIFYRLELDGILVCFCCSSLNKSPNEPSDINKTWLIQVSGGNSSLPQIRARNRKYFPISQPKNMLCVLKTTVSMILFF